MKKSVNLFLCVALASASFAVEKRKIDFVVGVDGDFKAALAAASSSGASVSKQFVIFLPDGEYELTNLTADKHGKTTVSASFVSIIGQSLEKTVISNKTDTESIGHTATLFFSKNNGVYMQDITLQNKSSFCGQSACRQVALQQNEGDKYIFKNVRLLSGQDTYYSKKGRTYWEGGEIDGTVDFICGGGNVFFEGTKLVMTRKSGYITASQSDSDWGYVFNNAVIEVSDNTFNKTFYLGRSWARAKTVFLNTIMKAEPTAEGWGPDMNSAPQVFGEYNSKNANGGAINTSQRKTYFNGGKDGSTATTLKTVWNANDAAKYTLANVLKGSDNWDPTKITAQVSAPKIEQQGAEIAWANDDNARAWVVFVNGKYKANVVTPSFSLDGIAEGSKITVRAANAMGGLGSSSNEVTTLESSATYFNVTLGDAIGGTVTTNLASDKVAEGKEATFTAEPLTGWAFAGWSGKSAPTGDAATTATVKITASGDIELIPSFTAKGTSVFQAEEGIIENAINESTNAGFAGSGYINFGTGTSTVKVPVYAETAGEYKLTMTYANGSNAARSLSIKAGNSDAQELEFETTANWTTYVAKETDVKLPAGASYITFATVGGNDGPNLDQVKLTLTKADVITSIKKLSTPRLGITPATHVRLFSATGKLLREATGKAVSMKGLPRGIYILQIRDGSATNQKIIRVK